MGEDAVYKRSVFQCLSGSLYGKDRPELTAVSAKDVGECPPGGMKEEEEESPVVLELKQRW